MSAIRVLLIEDNPGDARLVQEYLKESAPDVAFEHVLSLSAGLERLSGHDVEAVILDLSLPDATGLPALVRLKERYPATPIVILTGLKDEATALRAMRQGAQDYLVKGQMDGPAIARALRFAMERMRATSSSDRGLRSATSELRSHLDLVKAEHAALERLLAQQPPPTSALQPPAAGVTLQKRYLLRALLGRGSYGQAFLALDEMLGREVVVKVLKEVFLPDSEAERQFVKEARLLASLEHPHVIRVYDFGFHGLMPFYVMEHAEGGSLAERVKRGPLPIQSALRLTDQILQGLEYVHAHDVLHRDLKPGNILLNERQDAKIGDFGMALWAPPPNATSADLASISGGTPAYAAPEASLAQPLTSASDLYAVGAILFELLVNQPFAEVVKEGATIPRRRLQAIVPKGAAGEALARLVLSTLEKKPERRPQSAADLAERLRALRL